MDDKKDCGFVMYHSVSNLTYPNQLEKDRQACRQNSLFKTYQHITLSPWMVMPDRPYEARPVKWLVYSCLAASEGPATSLGALAGSCDVCPRRRDMLLARLWSLGMKSPIPPMVPALLDSRREIGGPALPCRRDGEVESPLKFALWLLFSFSTSLWSGTKPRMLFIYMSTRRGRTYRS